MFNHSRYHALKNLPVTLLCIAALSAGCGMIADKDRIRIAKIDDKYITRGDLAEYIYNMDDVDRPKIRGKSDLLRVLNQYIDQRIKRPLGQQFAAEGKIQIPRELARETFFRQAGDNEQKYRTMWEMRIPESGGSTSLMEIYDIRPEDMRAMKDIIEQETDRIIEKLLGDEAVGYLALQAYQSGAMALDEDALKREYRLRKDEFKKLEWMEFTGIKFPADEEGGLAEAAQVKKRIEAGENFEDIVNQYMETNPGMVIRSEIENNPGIQRFKGFWAKVSGAQPGDVLGPVFLPPFQQVEVRGGGGSKIEPSIYLVLKVFDHRPETVMTLEEARHRVVPGILVAQQMRRLRAEHGVEIYDEKLWDPAGYRDEYGDSVLNL